MTLDTLNSPATKSEPTLHLPRWALVAAWAACTAALLPLFYAASWAGGEVGKFQLTTYEAAAREALKDKDFSAALKYCDGAIKAGHNHSEHWGRVYTLRSFAYAGRGDLRQAANELIRAGDFFMRRYYYLAEQDRREVPHAAEVLGRLLLKKDDVPLALDVFSAGAVASGKPVDFLYDMASTLNPREKLQLWGGKEPYLLLTPFLDAKEDGPKQILNEQGREVAAPALENADKDPGQRLISVALDASKQDGNCWLGMPAYMALSSKSFGIRIQIKSDATPPSLYLSYWFEQPQKSANTTELPGPTNPDGWTAYDVRRDFLAERNEEALKNGYSSEGGIINQIGVSLPKGDATKLTFQPAQLYIPKA